MFTQIRFPLGQYDIKIETKKSLLGDTLFIKFLPSRDAFEALELVMDADDADTLSFKIQVALQEADKHFESFAQRLQRSHRESFGKGESHA